MKTDTAQRAPGSRGLGQIVAAMVLLLSAQGMWAAPPTAEQREAVRELSGTLNRAGGLFRDGKFRDSAELVREVQGKVETLAATGGKELLGLLDPLFGKLERAHALLELEGIELPALKKPRDVAAEAKSDSGKPPATGVSFVKQVVPVLVAKCGRCHVNDAKGMFSASSYENLIKGPQNAKVVFPGDPSGSRLIEVIESGDMPRGGLKLSPEELALLKTWIAEGAKFDGPNPADNVTTLNPNAKPADAPKLEVMPATGKETVSFARDVAPVLASQCANCHGNNQPRENFSLITFERLLRGGDGGPPLVPGNPAESLLVRKLKGTGGGQRMPAGREPLSPEVLTKIEKWIEEGARYDGESITQEINLVAALARARGATHEQLTADRAKLAADNWRLAMPGVAPARFESANFLVLGNVGENTLADIGARAEAVAPKVASLFKAPDGQPLIKGRMTLFVFGERYDYAEFGQMVQRGPIPKEWRGHWVFNVVDCYGALVPPRGGEYSVENLVAQQLAGAYIASLGRIPRWFAEGCARVAAARFDPQDARVAAWNEQLPTAVAAMGSPDDGIQGKLPPELGDVVNYSYVQFLASDTKRFPKLLDELRQGTRFDAAFSAIYGGAPSQVAETWIKRAAAKGSRPSPRTSPKKAAGAATSR